MNNLPFAKALFPFEYLTFAIYFLPTRQNDSTKFSSKKNVFYISLNVQSRAVIVRLIL